MPVIKPNKKEYELFITPTQKALSRLSLLFVMSVLPALSQAESLKQLVVSALKDHPAIQAQQSQKEASKAGEESAEWQFYPTPLVNVQSHYGTPGDRSYSGDPAAVSFGLKQPIYTGGRLTAGLNKAKAGVLSSNAAVDEISQNIALQVVQSYSEWLAGYLKTQVYEKNSVIYQRLRDMVTRRVQQGASSDSDLVLIVSRVESLKADMATANAQMAAALGRLGQLLGRRITSNELSNSITEPYQLDVDLEDLLDQAPLINPSIQKAKALALIQEAVIDERQANIFPEVNARVEEQVGSINYNNNSADTRVFLEASTRFGAGLSTLSDISGARAQYQAALDEVESQQRTLSTQIIADYTLASSSKMRLEALKQSMQASEEIFQSYDRQFLAGKRTWYDTMNSIRDLINIDTQVADTQTSRLLSTWRLAIYTQGVANVVRGS
jgi:adhesin transport system outer membrane protein